MMDALNLVAMDTEIGFLKSLLTNEMVTGDFPIMYKGNLDHEMMRLITDMAENKLIRQDTDSNVLKRVYHILVEALQNITRHSDNHDENDFGNGMFLFTQDQGFYHVVTGNKILNSKIEKLSANINHINSLSKEDLRELRRAQMRDGEWSEKGGAGLGLIDIARKSEEKIVCDFTKIDKDYSFFFMKISVAKE